MFTVIRKTDIGKTVVGKTDIGKSHTNKEHKNKENKNKEKREKSNALFENWFIECAYRFDAAFRQIVIWRADFCSGHCRGGYQPPARLRLLSARLNGKMLDMDTNSPNVIAF